MTSLISAASQAPAPNSLALPRLFPSQAAIAPPPVSLYRQNVQPVFSDRNADGDRLFVEEYAPQSSGEVDFPARRHHALTCQLGEPTRIFRKFHGLADERSFAPGEFSLCPAGEPASVRWQGKAHVLQILIPARWIAQAGVLLGAKETDEPLHVVFGTPSPQVVYAGLALQSELQSGCPGGTLYAETLASALAVRLLQHAGTHPLPPKTQKGGLGKLDLACVLAYISDHLTEELSLRELAACTSFSLCHFARLFKLSTGLPPHEYILRQRVDRAKLLLAAGKLTVGEVAQAVGFFDHSSLCRHFKRLLGVAPSQFQRQI